LVLALLVLLVHGALLAETISGRVVRVTDGDTIVVLDANDVQHKIRLQGIDAPERGQAYSTKSKAHLSASVAGKSVVVEYGKRDRYGRIVGKVLLSNEDMNHEQIRAGLAWHYKKYQYEQTPSDREDYSDTEIDAREAKRGIWREPEQMPPWEYRKAKRKKMGARQFMGDR